MALKTAVPMAALMRSSDMLVAVGIISIIIMMIVPVPDFLLDLLLTLNITLGLIIMLVSMYTKSTLEFSIFPSILLVSTLFRLALNISSTRLILLKGDEFDSKIIKAFGDFVVGGNYVVGIIIFLIITVIQFVVITKGAGRVAEVGARFMLDGMPGKQMSIDADFNAGIITEEQAKKKRQDLQQEADFYGSMDGASKFVQGDAIAGIVITIINIIGGLVIGVWQHEMPVGEAAVVFTLLTVGDGLVSQIPALLISTATGLVVTRAASDSNLGQDIVGQLLAQPQAVGIASGVLFFLGMIPGLPTVAFWTLGAVAGVASYAITETKKETKMQATEDKRMEEKEKSKKTENVASLLVTDTMELEIGYSLIPLVDVNQGGTLLERIQMLRRQAALELGLIVPPIRIRDNMQLKPDMYVLKIKGMEVATGNLMVNHYLAMDPGAAVKQIQGIETIEPAFGLPAIWITELQREEAELAGYTVADISSVVATHVTELIKRHASEILGRKEVQTIINTMRESYADLIQELIPTVLKVGEFQKILQNLLKEGVSIRNMITILETLADIAPDAGGDLDYITEKVRESLKRQITKQFVQMDGTLSVITLDPALEEMLQNAVEKSDRGAYLAVSAEIAQKIWASVNEESRKLSSLGINPVLLVSGGIRPYFKKFIDKVVPGVNVLSYNEIADGVSVNGVSIVTVA